MEGSQRRRINVSAILEGEKVTFAVGDTVYATTEKLPNGMLTTDRVFLIAAAAPRNTEQ
jgi:hypothetical protein